jgi:hypothetical protein
MYERLVGIRGQLAELVTAVDPDAVSGPTARQLWTEFDQVERLGAAGKTVLARRVAATHQPAKRGTKTAAEDLARKAGTSTGTARDSVETSTRLPDQPKLQQALRGGQLSTAQAALISSAVAANPAEEARLVELASRVSLGELREECARVKAAADPDPEATNRRLHAARQLRRWIDGEGFWNLHAKGTPQAGAAFNTVLQPIIDQLFKDAYRAGRREPVEAYAFDALMHVAEHVAGRCDCNLTTDNPDDEPDASADNGNGGSNNADGTGDGPSSAPGADSGDRQETGADTHDSGDAHDADTADLHRPGTTDTGQPTVADPAESPACGVDPVARPAEPAAPAATGAGGGQLGMFAAGRGEPASCGVRPRQTVNPRYLALLRVDVAALRRGAVAGGELCEVAGVGPVPVSVARGLLGDAILKLVVTDGVDVLNVTHLGRGPTAAQRAALLWTNPTCSVQGCTRSRVENDHREPWAHTRHTRLDELDPLCSFHHDLKTRLGWALITGKGKRAFVAPDDPRHPAYRTPRTDRPRPARPPGGQRPPDRAPERPPDRPPDRPAEQTEPTSADNATGRRRPHGKPRGRTGQQPGLFEDSQPP